MIDFIKQGDALILRYEPSTRSDPAWLAKILENADDDEDIPLAKRSFFVRKSIYRPHADDTEHLMDAVYHFAIGQRTAEGYFHVDRQVLSIKYELYIHDSLNIDIATFIAETGIPIFRAFDAHGFTNFYVGGEAENALPKEVFEELYRQFPTTYEWQKYARARVSSVIRSYVPIDRDFEAEYTKYRNRKRSAKGSQPKATFANYETDKFSALVAKIETMLAAAETYSEAQWQAEILQVIQLLYPKYVAAFSGAPVRDTLADKNREIDFLLVDASGYVDAIEIKKPFAECIVTINTYRDNHVPMRELSGTIMQLEKYLYHLNRWGQAGETKLNERYADKLPTGLSIRIVNPSGMIIMGRDNMLTDAQKTDFEVIRRKYRHVVEIMTYDDLLRRLKTIRDQFQADPQP